MLDKLQRIAQALRALLLPSVVVGLISLTSMVAIILTSRSRAGDTYLIPSAVGTLWAVTIYAFLTTFRSVPDRARSSWGLLGRLKRHIARGLYRIMGVLFLATMTVAVFVTYRMISVWLRDYVL